MFFIKEPLASSSSRWVVPGFFRKVNQRMGADFRRRLTIHDDPLHLFIPPPGPPVSSSLQEREWNRHEPVTQAWHISRYVPDSDCVSQSRSRMAICS